MERLMMLLRWFTSLDVDQMAFRIWSDGDIQKIIIELNTEGTGVSQLYDFGIDSTGASLKDIGGNPNTDSGYSPVTEMIKDAKGQRRDHITLKDTGEFYSSFKVVPELGYFEIDADFIKDDTDLSREWGEDIVGLTDESKEILIQYVRAKLIQKITEDLRQF